MLPAPAAAARTAVQLNTQRVRAPVSSASLRVPGLQQRRALRPRAASRAPRAMAAAGDAAADSHYVDVAKGAAAPRAGA
jgi:hypothetical protein